MTKKLHLGAGSRILKGWENLDKRLHEATELETFFVKWQAPSRLPYSPNTISFIFTEHFLEHLDEYDGYTVLKNSFDVLKDGGVMRICVPSLDKYVDLFIRWNEKKVDKEFRNGSQFLNYAIYGESWKNEGRVKYLSKDGEGRFFSPAHDHRYLYSEEDLSFKLKEIGFKGIRIVKWGESEHVELRNMEHHNDLAELIIEATK